ncbi:MAG: tryptophan-rich sensory protein [bacterium]
MLALGICVSLCLGVGMASGYLTADSVAEWYPRITKPSWTPPSWLFGPVWTILYVLMAVSAWRIWTRHRHERALLCLGIFSVQLAFNALWTGIFFGMRNPFLAFIEIIALWLLILLTIILFFNRDRLAGYLLIPYLMWVTFAAALNGAIAFLNM